MPDYQIADWAVERLAERRDSSLWLGVGFYRPHVPQFAPQKWFDLYPLETLQLPSVLTGDLEDISPYGIDITNLKHVSPTHEWVTENKEWKPGQAAGVGFRELWAELAAGGFRQRSDQADDLSGTRLGRDASVEPATARPAVVGAGPPVTDPSGPAHSAPAGGRPAAGLRTDRLPLGAARPRRRDRQDPSPRV